MDRLSQALEKQLRAVGSGHGRKKTAKTMIEGVRMIDAMLKRQITPDFLVYSPEMLTEQGRTLIDSLTVQGIKVYETGERKIREFSETEHSQGMIAIVDSDSLMASPKSLSKARLAVYLDRVSDPGNVGNLIRTCAAFGVDLIALSPGSAQITNPKILRAAAGAVFAQPIVQDLSKETLIEECRSNEIELLGTSGAGDQDIETYQPKSKVCLVLGSEAFGMGSGLARQCDAIVSIKSTNLVESLNVATAGAIVIYHLAIKMKLL